MGGVFINYRNEDEPWAAALVDHYLSARFGPKQVFRASRSVGPGDFQPQLTNRVEDASVLLAVIGRLWAAPEPGTGHRLWDEGDWVRREIEIAFANGVEVIPLLVDATMPTADSLPETLHPLLVRNYTRLHRRTVEDDLDRMARMVEQVAPELAFFEIVSRSKRARRVGPPTTLLDPHRIAVDFQVRDGTISELEDWCLTPAGAPLMLAGAGGVGKTRLAIELCERMSARGWLAAFVSSSAPPQALERLDAALGPALLVFDRAETRVEQLAAVVPAALRREENDRRIAVLVLARSAGEWFDMIDTTAHGPIAAQVGVREVRVPPGTKQEYDAARRGFAGELARPVPASIALEFSSAQEAHEAALADVFGGPVGGLIEQEYAYWTDTAPTYQLTDTHFWRFAQVVGAATLFGARDDPEALATLRLLPTFAGVGETELIQRFADWARELYPGTGALNPIVSGSVADAHLTRLLRKYPVLVDLLSVVSLPQAVRGLTVLAGLAVRCADVATLLAAALAAAPGKLMPAAVAAVAVVSEPHALVQAMTSCLDSVNIDELDAIVGSLPRRSLVLGSFALKAEEKAWKAHRGVSPPEAVAALALRFAARAAYLGERRDDAIAAALDHVESPSAEMSAEAWAVLAILYADDSLEKALQAGEIALATLQELGTPLTRQYVAAVLNQAVRLRAAGRGTAALRRAVEAVRLSRDLVARNRNSYLSLLADALDNLAMTTRDVSVAREALGYRRLLAERRVDAYAASYASTLNTIGKLLSEQDPLAAQESLLDARSRFEALRERHPGRFDRELRVVNRNLAALEEGTDA